jgi:hypothetical protein
MTELTRRQADDARSRLATFFVVDKESGCWTWTGGLDSHGYGNFALAGKSFGAHRISYLLQVGPIPDGLEIDHLCFNRKCINPEHLEPVTHQENSRRRSARLTACKWGHEFDEANTYRHDGKRRCRACNRRHQKNKKQVPK